MNGICWKIHPPSETLVRNVILGDTLIHGNTDNQRKLLADVNVSPPISACQITGLFNVLHREMQTAEMLGIIYENVNIVRYM